MPPSPDRGEVWLADIDNRRLIQGPLARLPSALMNRVCEAIREVLDLADT